jgi:aspartyl-tRNA(Asn)/glutamyl-tRNA(Gln) amidotransferase subunit C
MNLDRGIVERVARVAHISLSEEEIAGYEKDLADLLDCFDVLDRVPESGIRRIDPVGVADITREDEPLIRGDRDALLREMDTYDGYIRGPRLS